MAWKKDYNYENPSEASWNAAAEYSKLGIDAIQQNFDALSIRDYSWMYDNFLQKLNLIWAFLDSDERKEFEEKETAITKLYKDYDDDLEHIRFMDYEYSMKVPPNGASKKLFHELIKVDRRIQELFKIHKLTMPEGGDEETYF